MPNPDMFNAGYPQGAGTTGMGKKIGFAAGFAAAMQRKAARRAGRSGGGGGAPAPRMSVEDKLKLIEARSREARKNTKTQGKQDRKNMRTKGGVETFVHSGKVQAGVEAAKALPEASDLSTSSSGDFSVRRGAAKKATTTPRASTKKKTSAPSEKPNDEQIKQAEAQLASAHPLGDKVGKGKRISDLSEKEHGVHKGHQAKNRAALGVLRAAGRTTEQIAEARKASTSKASTPAKKESEGSPRPARKAAAKTSAKPDSSGGKSGSSGSRSTTVSINVGNVTAGGGAGKAPTKKAAKKAPAKKAAVPAAKKTAKVPAKAPAKAPAAKTTPAPAAKTAQVPAAKKTAQPPAKKATKK